MSLMAHKIHLLPGLTLAVSQGAGTVGPGRGQVIMQSSELEMEPVFSPATASTNSGWIVVEWMPSLWKNSFTFSATWK